MENNYTSENPSILEIAHALDVLPETVLQWIIEGRIQVTLQGPRTIVMVEKNQHLKNHILQESCSS